MTEIHDHDSYYVPESLARKLVVGARVRWRISSECNYICEHCGANLHGHYSAAGEGIIKTIDAGQRVIHAGLGVSECGRETLKAGHDYFIMEPPLKEGGIGFWAAAVELTPLDDEPEELDD